jgi:hypothetical protein
MSASLSAQSEPTSLSGKCIRPLAMMLQQHRLLGGSQRAITAASMLNTPSLQLPQEFQAFRAAYESTIMETFDTSASELWNGADVLSNMQNRLFCLFNARPGRRATIELSAMNNAESLQACSGTLSRQIQPHGRLSLE